MSYDEIKWLKKICGKFEKEYGIRIWGTDSNNIPRLIRTDNEGRLEISGTISAIVDKVKVIDKNEDYLEITPRGYITSQITFGKSRIYITKDLSISSGTTLTLIELDGFGILDEVLIFSNSDLLGISLEVDGEPCFNNILISDFKKFSSYLKSIDCEVDIDTGCYYVRLGNIEFYDYVKLSVTNNSNTSISIPYFVRKIRMREL